MGPTTAPRIRVIDAHTAGEPLRLILEGLPEIPGRTILEKRAYMLRNLDHLRTALMFEPRGHADMYGCILTEPTTEDGDLGVLFLHNEGYSTMCGHGVIALTKVAIEAGLFGVKGPVLRLDTPAGRVTAEAHMESGTVGKVSFLNVPSFVYKPHAVIALMGLGEVAFDIAFGGAFYAVGPSDALDLRLTKDYARPLIDLGMQVKRAVMAAHSIRHPFEKDLGFLYGTIFTDEPANPAHHSRNVCIFAEGEVDRSPTGTGVSARAAIHYARGDIGLRESITIESILGTTFDVEVAEETKFGHYDAVIPRVTGQAFITGSAEFILDPNDPLRDGFLIR